MTHVAPIADEPRVSTSLDWLSWSVARFPRLWGALAGLETLQHAAAVESVAIDRPIYVSGLARSGSTILLEILASHPHVATHQYRDFPAVATPIWWRRATGDRRVAPVERAHRDGLVVDDASPEALEEVLWMSDFGPLYVPSDEPLARERRRLERFGRRLGEHVRKLLWSRGATRYACKGNCNFARYAWIRRWFPGSRLIVPIRHPLQHVASLMKQHRLFCDLQRRDARVRRHLARVGHFEFGLDRGALPVRGRGEADAIMRLCQQGEELRGLARYWSSVYRWIFDRLLADPEFAGEILVVRYEDLCDQPRTTLSRLLEHAELSESGRVDAWAGRLHAPDYYRPQFSRAEVGLVWEEAGATAALYGYDFGSWMTFSSLPAVTEARPAESATRP